MFYKDCVLRLGHHSVGLLGVEELSGAVRSVLGDIETLVCVPVLCPGSSISVRLPPSLFLSLLSSLPPCFEQVTHHSSLPQYTVLSIPTLSVQIHIYKDGKGRAGPNHT